MPPPANSTEFLDLVQKSGVADEARLKSYLHKLTVQNAVPADPSKLAGLLLRDGLLTHFQAEQILQGKWKRFFIGKYKVLERIGSGGMGQVFLCEHKLMRRRVAVKVLPAAKAADPSSLDRFQREARAVAALDHPNVVRAYDIDQDDSLHFLVMEFVDGTNLQDLVKKFGVLDPLRASHYIYAAAVGLQHAHEIGLVHRDIKPGNILIDRSGVVKILDMGLARFFNAEEDDQLTRKYDENILGTADYLAPEQAIDSHTVDIRADIYSLGATFYFLLTGQPPFLEGTVAQKLLWHQTREPADVRALKPDVPPALADVVTRMMAKDVAKRYQTPAEVMAALAPWVQTPIPPPAEHEMPQLSAAAQGPGAGPGQSRVMTGSPTLALGSSKLTSGQPPSGAMMAPHLVNTGSDILRNSPAAPGPITSYPSTVHSPTMVAPVPTAGANPGAFWDEVTADTQTDAKADTGEPQPANPRPSVVPSRKRSRVRVVLAGIALATFLGLGGAAAAAYFLIFAKPDPTTQPAGSDGTWYVSKGSSPNPQRTLTTLRGALEQAAPDEAVVILDDHLDEPPISLKGLKKGVRIEAGNASKSVAWSPKVVAGRQTAAVLVVENVENVKISGLVFELAGTVDAGVSTAGHCPGLTLENITVKNPKVVGFRFQQVTADAARPIRLTKSRVKAEGKIEAAVALFVGNRFVVVQGCRFDGPGVAGFRVDGVAQECEFRNNRVFGFDTGVSFVGKAADETTYSLVIANNTFHTLAKAGLASELQLKGAKQKVDLIQNYFAATPAIAAGPAAGFQALKPASNARDAASKEGRPSINAVAVNNYALPTNAAADDFLFPPAASPLDSVGPEKLPVGARPAPGN